MSLSSTAISVPSRSSSTTAGKPQENKKRGGVTRSLPFPHLLNSSRKDTLLDRFALQGAIMAQPPPFCLHWGRDTLSLLNPTVKSPLLTVGKTCSLGRWRWQARVQGAAGAATLGSLPMKKNRTAFFPKWVGCAGEKGASLPQMSTP